ncbi:translocation/assembly module TamB domain-containing protein [Magnetococcales bacterium HHB-1]
MPLILVSGFYGALQSEPVRAYFLDQIEQHLGGVGLPTEIEGVSGNIPFHFQIERLTMADAFDRTVPWLTMQDIDIRWSLTDLWMPAFEIENVSVRQVSVNRKPSFKASSSESVDAPSEIKSASLLPDGLSALHVRHVGIDRLHLGKKLLGTTAATFTMHGKAGFEADYTKAFFDLNLQRVDQKRARIAILATVEPRKDYLKIRIDAEESGGLMRLLSGYEQAGNLRLSLFGEGPLSGWKGQLDVHLEGVAKVGSQVELAVSQNIAFGWRGQFHLANDPLGEKRAPWHFKAHILRDQKGDVRLTRFDVERSRVTLHAVAQLTESMSGLTADMQMDLPHLERLAPLIGQPITGGVQLKLSARGTVTHPEIQLSMRAEDLNTPQVTFALGDASVSIRKSRQEAEVPWRVNGQGRFLKGALPGHPSLPEGPLTWHLAATIPSKGAIRIDRLKWDGHATSLQFAGQVDPKSLDSQGTIQAVLSDLSAWRAWTVLPLQGDLNLMADLTYQGREKKLLVDLQTDLNKFRGISAAELLFGPSARLSTQIALRDHQDLHLSHLSLKGERVSLVGSSLQISGSDQTIQGRLDLDVKQLSAFSKLATVALDGNLHTQIRLDGTINEPRMVWRTSSPRVMIDSEKMASFLLTLHVSGPLDALAGKVALSMRRNGQDLKFSTPVRYVDDQIDLAHLKMIFPGGEINGPLSITPAGPKLDGQLRIRVNDPAALLLTEALKLKGTIDALATFISQPDHQTLSLTLDAAKIEGAGFGQLESAHLQADVHHLWRDALTLTVHGKVKRFHREDFWIHSADIQSKANLKQAILTINATGKQIYPFTVTTKAHLKQQTKGGQVTIEALDGHIARQKLHLHRPMVLTMAGADVDWSPFDLAIGEARLKSEGRRTSRKIQGDILVEIPMQMAASFGAPPMEGVTLLKGTFSGHPGNPEIDMDVNVQRFRINDNSLKTLPSINMSTSLHIKNGYLKNRTRIDKLTEKPIVMAVGFPVRLDLADIVVQIPPAAPLSGHLMADVDLARLAAFAFLDGWLVAGRLKADLVLSGNVEKPRPVGRILLSQGVVENVAMGLSLGQMEMVSQLQGHRLRIKKLTATDNDEGTFVARGLIAFQESLKLVMDLSGQMGQMRLIQKDDFQLAMSGKFGVFADHRKGRIYADLTTNRFLFYLPEDTGPDIEALQLQRSHSTAKKSVQSDASLLPPVQLDIKLNFPGQTFVRGRGLESAWRGQITVSGQLKKPKVLGTLAVHRGYLDVLHHRFALQKGIIDFAGSDPPTPVISIKAMAKQDDMTTIFALDGPASHPEITIRSEPEHPQDEILSRLLFRRDANKLSPAQAISLAAAVAKLKGGWPGVFNRLRDRIGIDSFQTSGDDLQTGTVKVGKYVGDKIYFEAERGMEKKSGKVRIEMQVHPNVRLETEVDQNQDGAFGINWSLDY